MPAEEAHEIGRVGVLSAVRILGMLLGDGINLPFNAYDHKAKLTFTKPTELGNSEFSFDLGGQLTRNDRTRFGGRETVEIFVEVKSVNYGAALLSEYKEFLLRAAIVSSEARHQGTWFVFFAKAPFGTKKGIELCDGTYLKECSRTWPEELGASANELSRRISVVIATESFSRLLNEWGQDAR